MTARYEVHPASEHPTSLDRPSRDAAFWHKRSANGEVTAWSEIYTRHEDAVRSIRTDIEDAAEILGISRTSFRKLYAPELAYFDAVYHPGDDAPEYVEAPLYPMEKEKEA